MQYSGVLHLWVCTELWCQESLLHTVISAFLPRPSSQTELMPSGSGPCACGVTRGEQGASLFNKEKEYIYIYMYICTCIMYKYIHKYIYTHIYSCILVPVSYEIFGRFLRKQTAHSEGNEGQTWKTMESNVYDTQVFLFFFSENILFVNICIL